MYVLVHYFPCIGSEEHCGQSLQQGRELAERERREAKQGAVNNIFTHGLLV